ncbi:hypothetical protein AAC387_Pa09g1951 [Persea americana]
MLSKPSTGSVPSHVTFQFLKFFTNHGNLGRARQLFDQIPEPNLHSWTILINAYTKWGIPKESIKLYFGLRKKEIEPDKFVLLSVAKACAACSDLSRGIRVHEDAIRFGFVETDLVLGNALINMYGKCGSAEGAQKVFDDMPMKDVISWTSIAASYVNCGLPGEALRVFREMGLSRVRPNSVAVSTVLPACSDLKALNLGREIHGLVVRNWQGENVFVSSGLVDMYAKCSSIRQARMVFDSMTRRDIVSWNVILTTYFSNGDCEEALKLFDSMKGEGISANPASYNAMIGGCIHNGLNERALELLAQMQGLGFKPNQITITSVLPACANLESLRGGMEIHGYGIRHWFVEDIIVATALLLMYAKCGNLEGARRIFDYMPRKDTVAWNTMILANSMHGHGEEALSLFREMIDLDVKPNSVTFTGVLSGCSHSRLVDESLASFNSMSRDHGMKPDADHYSCIVDVLGRAGRLIEAYEFIQKMPVEPSAGAWGALLGSCRVYKNVELGRIAANHLFEIEPDNPGNYILLSNIFVNAELWDDASKIRKMMRDRGITKTPGCSWIQVKDRVYTFVAGDKKTAQSDKIYRFLDELSEKLRLAGYIPDFDFALQDVDQEEKEEGLGGHSEKLAVAFGIMNLNKGSSIRVFKNLRICGDCHNFFKFTAKIVGVQIMVRDSMRFHHFRDGFCSCNDFW